MTTAHRPTWGRAIATGTNPTEGHLAAQTFKIANREAGKEYKLKLRQPGQASKEEVVSKEDFKRALEEREGKAREEYDAKRARYNFAGKTKKSLLSKTELEEKKEREHAEKKRRELALKKSPFPEDADFQCQSESDSSEDEEEIILRELAVVKAERAAEEEARRALQAKQEEMEFRAGALQSNPLLNGAAPLAPSWRDDTVFKNQVPTTVKPQLRYINDMTRSDFHKKFLQKYVWNDGIAR